MFHESLFADTKIADRKPPESEFVSDDMPLIEPTLSDFPCDTLARRQLEIARRADRLQSPPACSREADLACWLEAEAEVFAGYAQDASVERVLAAWAHGGTERLS